MTVVAYLETMRKAILGAVIAGVGALSAVLVGDTSFGDVTDGQWVAVALATLVALGGIWSIPNREDGEGGT